MKSKPTPKSVNIQDKGKEILTSDSLMRFHVCKLIDVTNVVRKGEGLEKYLCGVVNGLQEE